MNSKDLSNIEKVSVSATKMNDTRMEHEQKAKKKSVDDLSDTRRDSVPKRDHNSDIDNLSEKVDQPKPMTSEDLSNIERGFASLKNLTDTKVEHEQSFDEKSVDDLSDTKRDSVPKSDHNSDIDNLSEKADQPKLMTSEDLSNIEKGFASLKNLTDTKVEHEQSFDKRFVGDFSDTKRDSVPKSEHNSDILSEDINQTKMRLTVDEVTKVTGASYQREHNFERRLSAIEDYIEIHSFRGGSTASKLRQRSVTLNKEHSETSSVVSKQQQSSVTLNKENSEASIAHQRSAILASYLPNTEHYPHDSYSFLCFLDYPVGVSYGLAVFLFQILLELCLVLSIMVPTLDTNGAVADGTHRYLPGDVDCIVKFSQFLALLTFVLFPAESLRDITTAIHMFPSTMKAMREDDRTLGLAVSSILRLSQGIIAVLATLGLVLTSTNTRDVVLNFAAINFISTLDEVAFVLAASGYYHIKSLKTKAKEIEDKKLPRCIVGKTYPFYNLVVTVAALVVLMLPFLYIGVEQTKNSYLDMETFRVEFKEESALQDYNEYSGCYSYSGKVSFLDRLIGYRMIFEHVPSIHKSEKHTAKFGYCRDEKEWRFFLADHSNPCNILQTELLAKSTESNNYQIQNNFHDLWLSKEGKPLNIDFIRVDTGCGAIVGDGICDEDLNTLAFDWDGGDCCAVTCQGLDCGLNTTKAAFETNLTLIGNGYQKCKDKSMSSIIIVINDIIKQSYDVTIFQKGNTTPPHLMVYCDDVIHLWITLVETMKSRAETIKVKDGAVCEVFISKGEEYSEVDYTIYHNETVNQTVNASDLRNLPVIKRNIYTNNDSGRLNFEILPQCYFKELFKYYNFDTIYGEKETPQRAAIVQLIKESNRKKTHKCNSFLAERYVMLVMHISGNYLDLDKLDYLDMPQCMWFPTVTCSIDGHIVKINFSEIDFKVTLATEITGLKELKEIVFSKFQPK